MIPALRSEWLKFRTLRSNLIILVVALLGPPVIGLIVGLNADYSQPGPAAIIEGVAATVASITGFLLAITGIQTVATEYRFLTIRPVFAATPRRTTVMTSKVLLLTALAIVVTGLSLVFAMATTRLGESLTDAPTLTSQYSVASQQVTTADGRTLEIPTGTSSGTADNADRRPIAHVLGGTVAWSVLLTLLGIGLGSIVRHPAGAITTLLLWALAVENTLAAVIDGSRKWLPFQAGASLWTMTPDDPTRLGGGAVLAVAAASLLVVGFATVSRRDA